MQSFEDARFDFGIMAINSKNAGKHGHKISSNEVHARDAAITFIRVDDAHVTDNLVTWTNGFGSSLIGNTVVQAGVGIRLAGLMRSQAVQRAAQCVDSSGQPVDRYCETSADCFIPEIDATPVGTCPALIQDVFDGRNRDVFVEGNTLVGPFNSTVPIQRAGIAGGAGTVGGILRDNRIEGTGTESGITLLGNMLETAEVTGNVIHGASFGLLLQAGTASRFGARVFGNDITGSTTRAVGVLGVYAFPTELTLRCI